MKKIIGIILVNILINHSLSFSDCGAGTGNWFGLARIGTISVDKDYMTITPAPLGTGEYWCGTYVKIPMTNEEPYKTWRAQAYIALNNGNKINFHTIFEYDANGGVLNVSQSNYTSGWNIYFSIGKD